MRLAGHKILSRTPEALEIETEDGPAILRGYDPSLIEYEDLDEAKEANREQIDEGGRERLKQVGLGTLDEATIASVGELYEIIRGQSGNVAMLDHLQQIRRRWNDLIEANEAAESYAALEEARW